MFAQRVACVFEWVTHHACACSGGCQRDIGSGLVQSSPVLGTHFRPGVTVGASWHAWWKNDKNNGCRAAAGRLVVGKFTERHNNIPSSFRHAVFVRSALLYVFCFARNTLSTSTAEHFQQNSVEHRADHKVSHFCYIALNVS